MRQRIFVPKNIPGITNMVQFTQAEGEMKAHASMFTNMGRSPPPPSNSGDTGDWTGNGGGTFDRLAKEASSPISEAENSYADTLKRHTPHYHDDSNLYSNWDSSPNSKRHHLFKTETHLERMRDVQRKEQHSEDRQFFAGVKHAFGKKKGGSLMRSFDPSLKSQQAGGGKNTGGKKLEKLPTTAGVAGDTAKIKALVASLKKASGDKGVLRKKMQELQSKIDNDFHKVTAFGSSAKTELSREEGKKAKAGGSKAAAKEHKRRRDGRPRDHHLVHQGDPFGS